MKNVKTDFGAVGDGSTDDTTAIRNAVNACSSGGAFPGVQLLFPAGTYKITGTINLSYSNYNLVGEGPSASVISYTGAVNTLPGGHFNVVGSGAQSAIYMSGLRMTCATAGGSSYGVGISGSGAITDLRFTNCKFDRLFAAGLRAANKVDVCVFDTCEFASNGLQAYGSDPSTASINGTFYNTMVRNCYFHDTGYVSTLNHTIYMNGGCQNVQIVNNLFKDIAYDCCSFGTSSDGYGSAPQNFGMTFANNTCINFPGTACRSDDVTGVTMTGNTVINGAAAFNLGPNSFAWNISNNNVSYSKSLAEAAAVGIGGICTISYGASNGVICNNVAGYSKGFDNYYYTFGTAIRLDGGKDIEIYGNTITGYNLGIAVFADNGGGQTCNRINIHDNYISITDGAIDNTGGRGYFGAGVSVGIGVNGYSTDVYMQNNFIRNMTHGVHLCNSGTIGPVAPQLYMENIFVVLNQFFNVTSALYIAATGSINKLRFEWYRALTPPEVDNFGQVREFTRVTR